VDVAHVLCGCRKGALLKSRAFQPNSSCAMVESGDAAANQSSFSTLQAELSWIVNHGGPLKGDPKFVLQWRGSQKIQLGLGVGVF
jgi:hypothetical protein